uniref:RAB11 family interacting protein 3 (class II) n=1 Tax=Gasterosteus aculeatus aculeatus TaxID=481459 RepID=G3P0R3_GASAC
MEASALSGPLGHSQWDSEHASPLGFHPPGSDNGEELCPDEGGQTGLDFRDDDDRAQAFQQSEGGGIYQDRPVELDNLINMLDFSCGDVQFEGDQSENSKAPLHDASLIESVSDERPELPDELNDYALSWLFSPKLTDVVGKVTAREDPSLTPEDLLETSNAFSAQLISLSPPLSPSKPPDRHSETNTGGPFLLVDLLSNGLSCLPPESSGELNPQGVSEELVDLSQEEGVEGEEEAGLSPSQRKETLSHETRDKGSFPDQVTDLPLTCSRSQQGLPENHLPPDKVHTPPRRLEGSVSLLDLKVPDCDSSLSLRPASPPALIRTGVALDLSTEECEGGHGGAAVNRSVTSERRGENDSFALRLSAEASSAEPSSLTGPPAEDVFIRGGFICSVESGSTDLMEENICSEAQNQGNQAMALDLCLTAEEVHDEETWDLKPGPDVQNGSVLHPSDEERTTDGDRLDGTDCREVASFDFSVEDLHASSPEAGWTSEQTVETISLSKMVVDDSLPMVSAVNAREEDASPLKAVFDALDQDGDGFVRIEEFMEFAAAYGADQVKDLTKFLDPSGLGVISFEDFHRGISAISNGGPEPPLYNVNYSPGDGAVGCPEEYDEQNEVTDSAYLGSESTYSECETFTDEDTGALVPPEMHEDVETDSGIEAALHDPEDGGNSGGKRVSSKKVARHLLQNSSMTLDTMSDLTRDILELADNDITDKVLLLERRVAELEKESESSGEHHARLRQDNLHLVHRANALEEQLKEQELHADEQLQQEARRHKEALVKLERERGLELENLQARLQQLDEENSELRSCVPCLRANIERLEEEKRKLQDETDAMADKLEEETESRRKMADKLSHERHHSGKEKECTQELIEDLRKQLEHLQLYKLEAEAKRGRTPGAGLQEYQTRTREAELEQEIKRLKQDNRSLKEQNDELNGQIINLSIQGAKNLMSASFSDSLAAEINNVSRVELMETVHKQEEINYRLQDYIDKIIVAIMECNPSILEVK